MEYLSFEHINKSYGEKVLFEDLSFNISKGQKVALVAKNGTGKTTLLKILAGEEAVEGENAKVKVAKNIKIAFLKQEPSFDLDQTILDAALDSDNAAIRAIKEYELATSLGDDNAIQEAITVLEDLGAWDVEARVKEVLSKLNLHHHDQKIRHLSGGQVKRLALAKIIIDEPDFVILDEPTNHLDLDMIEWLENYLSKAAMTIFMVTHDRYFLERVCNEIIEIDRAKLHYYKGNYSDFLEKKALRHENESAVLDKTQKLFKKELNWIRRQPKARGTKAKSRVDTFDVIKEAAHQNLDEDTLQLNIVTTRLGSKIVETHALTKSFDQTKIVESFSYKFKKKERVGIVGANGVGKTSFIKLLTKELRPDGGKVVVGDTVVFGHYSQAGLDLSEDKRVIDIVRDIADYIPLEKGKKLTAESLLERFLFPRPQQQVYISQLSGGEKRRLHLLTVLIKNPNFLILDEPTNDLDIVTINILEEYLLQFPGCIIIISHDRFFMDKLVDHLFVMEGQGQIRDYNGNYTKYRAENKFPNSKSIGSKGTTKTEVAAATPASESTKRKLSYAEKMEIEKLEKEIEKLNKKKQNITAQFSDSSLSGDQIAELSKELGDINKTIEQNEEKWFELQSIMEG